MPRVSMKLLLAGCAVLLLAIDGCWSRTGSVRERGLVAARQEEGDKRAPRKEKGAPFRLPDDDAGRLLGRTLAPSVPPGPLKDSRQPAPPQVPLPRFTEPPLHLPAGEPAVARLPAQPHKKPLRPRLVVEEQLGEEAGEPPLPRRPSFAAARRVAEASEDVSLPPPLPLLARPLSDPVPVEDATMSASTAAVLAAPLPRRTAAVPFTPTRVPEPFAHRRTRPSAAEETTVVADSPAVPK